jgi:hypothetical protein
LGPEFFEEGLVTVPFWEYWTSPEKVAILDHIYRLGDVQWGHLMTHVEASSEKSQ